MSEENAMALDKKKKQEQPAEEPAETQEATEETEKEENEALKKAQAQAEEYLDMAQRVQADFENYRRRTKATRAEAFEDGAREFIKNLLQVYKTLQYS